MSSPLLLDRLVLGTLRYVPTPLMRRLSARYIAGETLPEAIAELARLEAAGHPGIIDILGENVTREDEARTVLEEYKEASTAVHAKGLDAYVSVKPTHFGLNASESLAYELYDEIAKHAGALGQFVRVEMEDHPTTDATLRIFESLRADHDNVGIVLQSRLFRTLDDIDALAPGPLHVRLVKGIYLEPASIAHLDPDPIRKSYVDCAEKLAARGAHISFATHDDVMAPDLIDVVKRHDIPKERYEFQVLLGVREPLWKAWKEQGHTVRVYVPYGPEWRAYSLRRLHKNPQLLRAVIKNTLGL